MVGESVVPCRSNRGAENEGCRGPILATVGVAGPRVVGASAPGGGAAAYAGVKAEPCSFATVGHGLDDEVTTGQCTRNRLKLQPGRFLRNVLPGERASWRATAGAR